MIPSIPNNLVAVTDAELEEIVRSLHAAREEIRTCLKKVNAEREKRQVTVALRKDIERLQGKYDTQTLAAVGIPSAESVGQAGT